MNVSEHKPVKTRQRDQMSPSQLDRDLRRETYSAPQFVYPLAIGAGLTVVAWALGLGAAGWALLAAGASAMVGSGGWAALRQFVWRDRLVYDRMLRLQKNMLKQIEDRRSRLRAELKRFRDGQALQQLENLTSKFELLTRRLGERFEPGELTYIRYVGTAEQVYLGALDNLRTVVEASEALSTMDRDQLVTQQEGLLARGQPGQAEVIKERVEMFDRYQRRIQEALGTNEAAITRLSQVHEALVSLNTGQGLAREPLEQAMDELARLAERTDEYGI